MDHIAWTTRLIIVLKTKKSIAILFAWFTEPFHVEKKYIWGLIILFYQIISSHQNLIASVRHYLQILIHEGWAFSF